MYKRPTLKVRPGPKLQFVTEIRSSGATASQWVPVYDKTPIIPNGTPGRVGEIIDAMRQGEACIRRPSTQPWTPHSDYEFIAKHTPESERELYITKCREWFEANSPPVPPEQTPSPKVNHELIQALFAKHPGQVPPLKERIKVYRAAGHTEAYIERAIARHKHLEATSDERQKVIDAIWGKWPSANKTTKTAPKVIKAVKKKMA